MWDKLVTGSPSPVGGRETSIAELAHFFLNKNLNEHSKDADPLFEKVIYGFLNGEKLIYRILIKLNFCYCQSSPLSFPYTNFYV